MSRMDFPEKRLVVIFYDQNNQVVTYELGQQDSNEARLVAEEYFAPVINNNQAYQYRIIVTEVVDGAPNLNQVENISQGDIQEQFYPREKLVNAPASPVVPRKYQFKQTWYPEQQHFSTIEKKDRRTGEPIPPSVDNEMSPLIPVTSNSNLIEDSGTLAQGGWVEDFQVFLKQYFPFLFPELTPTVTYTPVAPATLIPTEEYSPEIPEETYQMTPEEQQAASASALLAWQLEQKIAADQAVADLAASQSAAAQQQADAAAAAGGGGGSASATTSTTPTTMLPSTSPDGQTSQPLFPPPTTIMPGPIKAGPMQPMRPLTTSVMPTNVPLSTDPYFGARKQTTAPAPQTLLPTVARPSTPPVSPTDAKKTITEEEKSILTSIKLRGVSMSGIKYLRTSGWKVTGFIGQVKQGQVVRPPRQVQARPKVEHPPIREVVVDMPTRFPEQLPVQSDASVYNFTRSIQPRDIIWPDSRRQAEYPYIPSDMQAFTGKQPEQGQSYAANNFREPLYYIPYTGDNYKASLDTEQEVIVPLSKLAQNRVMDEHPTDPEHAIQLATEMYNLALKMQKEGGPNTEDMNQIKMLQAQLDQLK